MKVELTQETIYEYLFVLENFVHRWILDSGSGGIGRVSSDDKYGMEQYNLGHREV